MQFALQSLRNRFEIALQLQNNTNYNPIRITSHHHKVGLRGASETRNEPDAD
jgi:hypothetical protein